MLKVTFFLCERMLATSMMLPLEYFRAAASVKALADGLRPGQTDRLSITMVSVDGEAVTTHTGVVLSADAAISDIHDCDLLMLPALWRNPRPVIEKNKAMLPWLRQHSDAGTIIAGVGTGCYFMAEAGMLDHKAATTHWHYFDSFRRRYPKVQLKPQYFLTQADNLYCAGSVNSLADLTIHFIGQYFSKTTARHVERHFFHEIRQAYNSPTSHLNILHSHPDETIAQIQSWMQSHLEQNITFSQLAPQFDMSLRTLNRRFKQATGVSPLHYLQTLRMDSAKDLLKNTNLSIHDIVSHVGYADEAHFQALFKRHHNTTPSAYRTTVRAKLFSLSQGE